MISIGKCILAFIVYMFIFGVWGTTISKILKWNIGYIEKVLYGFFVYYVIFQVVYLPIALTKGSFLILTYIWLGCVISITLGSSIYLLITKTPVIKLKVSYLNPIKYGWVYALFILFGLGICFIVLQYYCGWDTSYYIGSMNEAIYTDTIYCYNGNSGMMEKELPIRYVMSGFYMQFAICSKLIGVKPVILAFYLVRLLCVVLSGMIVFCIGKGLFEDDCRNAGVMVLAWELVNLMWFTIHATPLFLINRSYEAKGYCSNIVLPMVFYCILLLYQKKKSWKSCWQKLFLICMASIPISMSSLITVPVMVFVGIFVLLIFDRNKRIILYGLLCLLPNVLYVIMYLLNILKIWVVEV